MTPEQIKSYLFAHNTITNIAKERSFFNTMARVDLVKSLYIFGALLEEDLMSKEQCAEFDRLISTLTWQLERPYFLKFKEPIFKSIKGMPHKARMNLFRKIRKVEAERNEKFANIFAGLQGFGTVADTIELFIERYGGGDEMLRLLNFT